jgi:GT2 family glycosyltransferase
MKTSVAVPKFNRPSELRLCLLNLSRQSVLPDEVLIAHDGSGEDTRKAIMEFEKSPDCLFSLTHVWQDDVASEND